MVAYHHAIVTNLLRGSKLEPVFSEIHVIGIDIPTVMQINDIPNTEKNQ